MRTRRNSTSRGQTLVLLAVLALVLLAFIAFAADLGNAYAHRRRMQNAADAAALAGAWKYCMGDAEDDIIGTARYYAQLNGAPEPSGGGLPGTGGGTDPTQVYLHPTKDIVTVTTGITFPTFVAGVVGMPEMHVRAIAAAECIVSSGGGAAVWAHSDNCDDNMKWTGNKIYLEGDVHSNNDLEMGSSESWFNGLTTHVNEYIESGNKLTITVQQVPYNPVMPINLNISDYGPSSQNAANAGADYHHITGNFEFLAANMPAGGWHGLWYIDGDMPIVKIKNAGQFGTFTVVTTGRIHVTAADLEFYPYVDGLLFFANYEYTKDAKAKCTTVLELQGSNNYFEGIWYAPRGGYYGSGCVDTTMNTAIVAWRIELSGSNLNIIGWGGSGPGVPRVRLIH